jgi:ABC-2 type transport system permease protein
LALASVLALALVNTLSTWLGAALTDAPVTFSDTLASSANLLPVILLFGGIAVAMFGIAPRLTIAVPAGAVGVAYILSLVGPALDLPGWVTGISPFYHVSLVPVADYALTQGLVMCGLAVLTTLLGWAAFNRRDLLGA